MLKDLIRNGIKLFIIFTVKIILKILLHSNVVRSIGKISFRYQYLDSCALLEHVKEVDCQVLENRYVNSVIQM